MKNIFVIFILLLPFTAFGFGDMEEQEKTGKDTEQSLQQDSSEMITVSGLIRLVGSEPFSQFIVQTADGDVYYLPDNIKGANSYLIGRKITVQGKLEVFELVTVDGKFRRVEKHLADVKILAILQ